MWFYKIEKDVKHKKLHVVWNTGMTYAIRIIGITGILCCLLNQAVIAWISLAILAVLLGYYLYRYGSLVQILHAHERLESLEYTGSRYSFKDPLRVSVPLPGKMR